MGLDAYPLMHFLEPLWLSTDNVKQKYIKQSGINTGKTNTETKSDAALEEKKDNWKALTLCRFTIKETSSKKSHKKKK